MPGLFDVASLSASAELPYGLQRLLPMVPSPLKEFRRLREHLFGLLAGRIRCHRCHPPGLMIYCVITSWTSASLFQLRNLLVLSWAAVLITTVRLGGAPVGRPFGGHCDLLIQRASVRAGPQAALNKAVLDSL